MKRIGLLMLILTIVASHIPSTIASQPNVFREPALAIPSATTAQSSYISSAASPDNMEQPSVVTTASNVITLTINGLQPSVLTTTFGADVMWINTTSITHTLVSGEPYRLYLPLVLRSGGVLPVEDTALPLRDALLAGNSGLFTVTLPPGGVFTYTFFTSGSVPYFLADAPQLTGRVIVQLDLPPDPIEVAPPLDPTVPTNMDDATRFLYTGSNPIQTGVVSGTIEARRVAVLRGRVLTRENRPLPGVTITVLDHPEYGQTKSRADGMFDLAVNGGGPLTLNYDVIRHLPAQRQVDVPWLDYVTLPDVVLIREDPNTSLIDLNASIPVQVARGSVIIDSDGVRQETLFFPQGTTAYLSFANGMTQTITTMHVRATEYTVGPNGQAAMPAELPPNSAYTYATIFHADEAVAAGAEDVWFNPPIISYVENFISFTLGITIPMGYYDDDRSRWIPSDSGRVIQILSITNNQADLDIDGSNTPASPAALAALGVSDAERAKLAELYVVGQSLWRVPVPHFDASWDKNQGTGCEEPCPEPKNIKPKQAPQVDSPRSQCGSIIGCETQTLGEAVDIVGTSFRLHYQSDRMPGYSTGKRITIPLTGDDVSPKLKRVELSIFVAGKSVRRYFLPAFNLEYTYVWDGRDAYGRVAQGKQPLAIWVTYVYPLVYQATDRFGSNGNGIGLFNASDMVRTEFKITRRWYGDIGGWNAKGAELGGWMLDAHHTYAAAEKTLYLGNGTQRSAESLNFLVVNTVAGNGMAYPPVGVDGNPATQVSIGQATSVAARPDGGFYIASKWPLYVIRLVDASGIITTVAGTSQACSPATDPCGDGGPATQARLAEPFYLALGLDGSLYISDRTFRIRRIGPDGIITTVAGNGVQCTVEPCGDGGPAIQAQLTTDAGNKPPSIAVGPDGSLYVVHGHRVRRVAPDGLIHTVAGGYVPWFGGDGGPATQAYLNGPNALDVGPDGSLYISDNNRIRVVGPTGIITTVAGCGSCTPPLPPLGDGGPALEANLAGYVNDVNVGPDGSLYILNPRSGSTITHHGVRQVTPDGIINTIVGGSVDVGFSGDGGQALGARFYYPNGLDLAPDGSLLIADTSNHRVRRVASALPGGVSSYAIPSENGGEMYLFDGRGRHQRTLHTLTGATLYEFAYDTLGRLISVTDGDGNITTINRDSSGNPTGITGPYGQTTTFTLDANGYLASIANPAGETTEFTYTADGLLTSMRDARNANYTFWYDTLGRLIRDDDPVGGFKTLSRAESKDAYTVTVTTALSQTTTYLVQELLTGAQKRSITYPNGLTGETLRYTDGVRFSRSPDGTTQRTTLGPDPRWGMLAPIGTLVTLTTPSGLTYRSQVTRTAEVTNTNNPFSLVALTETVNLNGRTYASTYDAATRTWVERSPLGRTVTTMLDAQGRVVFEQITGLEPTIYAYDARGRLITATLGSGAAARTATFAYNSQGYLASVTDPLARTVTLSYDATGRVLTQTLPGGRTITFAYDANSNLTALTPPGRPAHTFEYTPLDLTSRYTPPDVNPGADDTQYAYNLNRQPAWIARPDGQTIDVGYDSAGRPAALTIARGIFDYAYDPATGNLAGVAAPGSLNLAYTYDGELLTSQAWSGAITGTTIYTYDNDLRLTTTAVNGNNPIALQYDDDSLLTQTGALTLNRDLQNGLLTGSMLGSITDTWSYNGFGEPIDYTAGSLFSVRYERDKLGHIITKTETINGVTEVYIYAYDLAGRLSGVARNGAAISAYNYDSNGNRLTHTNAGGTITGTYDAQDRLLQYGKATYSYTANGELLNRTSGGQTTNYQYDALGNLITVTLPTNAQIVYLIDGQQRRVGKQVNGVLTQGFLYESQLRPVAELDSAGNIVSRFVYATRVNVPDYMIKGGATYRFILDHLGSPRLIVNAATRQIVQRMDYDEFGRVLLDTNPGFQPFGFAGGLYDLHTGLVRFGARDYDAMSGRWTAKDLIGFDGGDTNLYGYVLGEPVNRDDPDGLVTVKKVLPNGLILYRPTPTTPEMRPYNPPAPRPGGGILIGWWIANTFGRDIRDALFSALDYLFPKDPPCPDDPDAAVYSPTTGNELQARVAVQLGIDPYRSWTKEEWDRVRQGVQFAKKRGYVRPANSW